MTRRLQIVALVALLALFAVPILFESFLRLYQMPITGWVRTTWGVFFLASSLFLTVTGVRQLVKGCWRSPFAWVCLVSVATVWIVYPMCIKAYAAAVNRNRSDSQRWVYSNGVYYFTDTRYTAYSALIVPYPPYFSLPKDYDAEQLPGTVADKPRSSG